MTQKKAWYLGAAIAAIFILAVVIARVSAATFDSDIVPNTGSTYQLGTSPEDWRSINDTIFFNGSKVGISDNAFAPSARLHVQGNVLVEGDVYFDSSSYGAVLKASDGSCWRLTVADDGTLSTVSEACL